MPKGFRRGPFASDFSLGTRTPRALCAGNSNTIIYYTAFVLFHIALSNRLSMGKVTEKPRLDFVLHVGIGFLSGDEIFGEVSVAIVKFI